MATPRRFRLVRAQLGWMLAVILVLAVFDELELGIFASASLAGLLVLTEATDPVDIAPRWRTRLSWLVGLGVVLFGLLVVYEMVQMLPSGVF